MLATPAWTGCDDKCLHEGEPAYACQGKVLYSGHVEIVTKDSDICTIWNKAIIKRLLKVCPDGSQCNVLLSRHEYRNDKHYRGHGVEPAIEITKWPARGINRNTVAERNKP